MFKRRVKRTLGGHIREAFWPSAGWARSTLYVIHRVARIPGTPHNIAAGFACGAAMSFTPLVGAHALLGMVLALVVRGNLVATIIGTVVGNPWTFPFIWVLIYRLGRVISSEEDSGVPDDVEFADLFGQILDALFSFDLAYLAETAWPVWSPMMIGSIPVAIAAWLVFYVLIKIPVAAYQKRRIRWRHTVDGHQQPGRSP